MKKELIISLGASLFLLHEILILTHTVSLYIHRLNSSMIKNRNVAAPAADATDWRPRGVSKTRRKRTAALARPAWAMDMESNMPSRRRCWPSTSEWMPRVICDERGGGLRVD